MLNMVKNASVQATDIYKDPYGYTYSEMVGVLGEVEADKFYRELYSGSQSIKQKDGTDFTLPPDLSSTKRARQGEYKLRSTGEVVVNPDFLATWNLNKAKEE